MDEMEGMVALENTPCNAGVDIVVSPTAKVHSGTGKHGPGSRFFGLRTTPTLNAEIPTLNAETLGK